MLTLGRSQLHETSQRRTLCKQELEFTFLANGVVKMDDLLPHIRDLTALGSLYWSLVRLSPSILFSLTNARLEKPGLSLSF